MLIFFILNRFGNFPRSLILFIMIVIDLTKSVPAIGGLKISLISPKGSRHFSFFKDLRTLRISFSVQVFDFIFFVSNNLFSQSFCCNWNKFKYSFLAGLCLNLCVKVSKYRFLIPFGSVNQGSSSSFKSSLSGSVFIFCISSVFFSNTDASDSLTLPDFRIFLKLLWKIVIFWV